MSENNAIMLGCDLSRHNYGKVNPSYMDFVILKASEGRTFQDKFTDNYIADMASEVPDSPPFIGFYHYARSDNNDPHKEVDNFLTAIEPHIGNCFCALDYEGESLQAKVNHDDWAIKWLYQVEYQTGSTPFLYTSSAYVHLFPETLKRYPLWVAHYNVQKPTSKRVRFDYKMWQYTSKPFDMNIFYGSPADMVNIIHPVSTSKGGE